MRVLSAYFRDFQELSCGSCTRIRKRGVYLHTHLSRNEMTNSKLKLQDESGALETC